MHCSYEKSFIVSLDQTTIRKWCENVLNILVWTCGIRKKMVPVIVVAVTAHHTPTLTSCTTSWWMNIRPVPVTTRVHLSLEKKLSFITKQNEHGVYFFLMHCMKVLVHKIQSCSTICVTVCESQMCDMDENAAVLLCFLLVLQTCLFVCLLYKLNW
jgi:hypothetical protein